MKALALVLITAAGAAAQQIPEVGTAGPQPTLPGNTVVATVAGISVTIDDVRKMMENAPPAATNLIQQRGPQEFILQTFVFRHLADLGDNLKLGEESPLKEQLEAERRLIIASAMVTNERNYYQVSEEQVNDLLPEEPVALGAGENQGHLYRLQSQCGPAQRSEKPYGCRQTSAPKRTSRRPRTKPTSSRAIW